MILIMYQVSDVVKAHEKANINCVFMVFDGKAVAIVLSIDEQLISQSLY